MNGPNTDQAAGADVQVSVIVPTFNRPQHLAECLTALAAQDHPSFEVVVVDDGSTPPVADTVASFHRRNLTYVRQENAGPAAARNAGAARARGLILAFTDDDCRPDSHWLSALTSPIAATPDLLTGGETVNALTENIHAEVSQDLVSFLYANALSQSAGFDFFTSNNMACTKERFLALGGFDETFPLAAGEDRDFGLRWKRNGGPMAYLRDAKVQHHHTLTLRRFWRQQSNYGRGAHHLRKRFNMRREQAVPFAGVQFYLDMMTFPFRQKKSKPLTRSMLLATSQVAMAAGFFADWIDARGPASPRERAG